MKKLIFILLALTSVASGYFEISNDVPSIFSASSDQQWRLWSGGDLAAELFNNSSGILFDEELQIVVIGKFTPGTAQTLTTTVGFNAGLDHLVGGTTSLGFFAGFMNAGVDAVSVGDRSGEHNTGASATGIGPFASFQNTGLDYAGIGNLSGQFNDGNQNTALGSRSFTTWTADTGSAKAIASVDVPNQQVTITAGGGHGFGSAGEYLNLRMTTTGTLPAGMNATSNIWKVIDATTMELYSGRITFTDTGTGTHTLTPQVIYDNSTAVGFDAEPTASNQVVLGDASVTSILTTGAFESPLKVTNSTGTDAVITMDGTSTNPADFTYESDNSAFVIGAFDFIVDAAGGPTLVVDAVGDTVNGAVFFGDASDNVSFGTSTTLGSLTTGSNNVALGDGALQTCTEGINNFALGDLSMGDLTTGDRNVGIGILTLQRNLVGNNNIAIGEASLRNNKNQSNVAIGSNAMVFQTTGDRNTGIGGFTGYRNVTGDDNVCIGYKAGQGITGNSFSFNTYVGKESSTLIETGSSNVSLGYQAGFNQTTLSDRLIIDNQDRGSAAAEITDCLIYGIFDATPANQSLRINATVKATGYIVETSRVTSSPYAVLATDDNIFVDTDGGAITVNLPAGIDGKQYRIINVGTSGNDVTLAPDGAELLNGTNANISIFDGEKLIFVYEDTEGWF